VTELVEARTRGLARRTPVVSAVGLVLAGCAVTVAAVTHVLLAAPAGTRGPALPVFVIGAVVVFGLGLADLARAQDSRFALALIFSGLLWSLSALSASTEPALYSLGRVNQWTVYLAIVYLLLSYPSGRLTDKRSRWVFTAAALVVGLLYLPTAVVVQHFPAPGLWSNCTAGCPSNAFAVGHSDPALVRGLVTSLRDVLAVGLFTAAAIVVTRRNRRAGPLLGQMYAPIAWIAVCLSAGFALYFPIRAVAPRSWALLALSWILLTSLPAVALAVVAARLHRRIQAADAVDQVARALRTSGNAAHVGRALATALDDPSLRILQSFPGDSGRWVDDSGVHVVLPTDTDEQGITEISSDGWRIAILHDPALREVRSLVQTAGSYALTTLEVGQLNAELRASLQDLAKARARGLAAEQRGRQKIERDLHDGAQQRLVAVRVKLGLAAGQLEDRDPPGAAVIRALGEDIDATIDEVRAFARGIYPSLLAETGLREALRGLARTAALPVTVHADRLGRYPPEIETTVYFSCSEAVQNAAKHARGATGVTISLWQDRKLYFKVRDDGAGFDVHGTRFGTGLTNLHDRVAAVDGTIAVHSIAGHGTTITGSIPIP
jgi:signal transduction histidine kinase